MMAIKKEWKKPILLLIDINASTNLGKIGGAQDAITYDNTFES